MLFFVQFFCFFFFNLVQVICRLLIWRHFLTWLMCVLFVWRSVFHLNFWYESWLDFLSGHYPWNQTLSSIDILCLSGMFVFVNETTNTIWICKFIRLNDTPFAGVVTNWLIQNVSSVCKVFGVAIKYLWFPFYLYHQEVEEYFVFNFIQI